MGIALVIAGLWKISLTPEYRCATGDSRTRHEIIISLPRKARWRARLMLGRLMHDRDCEVRVAALACVRMMDLKELAPDVSGVIREDPEAIVSAQAIEVLAKIDPASAAPVVLEGLKDARPDIRMGSLLAARHGLSVPEADLLATLTDGDSRVREAALETVTKLRVMNAVPVLAGDLEKQQLFELSQTHDALQKITGVNKGIAPDAWIEWYGDR